MSSSIRFEELDFFGVRLLSKKDCRVYVRSGKAYMYIDNQRYDFGDTPPVTDTTKFGLDFEVTAIDASKDVTVDGFFYFWQKEQYYCAAIIDHKRKHPPMIIRAGDSLSELENESE